MHWQLLMFFDMLIYQWDHSRLYFIGIIQSDVFPKVFNIRIRKSVQDGLSKLVVVNGHYENQMFTIEAIELVRRDAAMLGVTDLTIFRCEYCIASFTVG